MTDFRALITLLVGAGVEFIIVGGAAARAHGSARCLGLEHLIHVKRAAGRPKDLEAIAELEAILEEQRKQS